MVEAKPQSLRKNFSWTFAGNMANALSLWGVVILLAKWVGADGLGQYNLGLAWAAPIFLLLLIPRGILLITDLDGEVPFCEYLTLRVGFMALGLISIPVLAIAGGYHGETLMVIIAIGAMKAIDGVSEIFRALYIKHEKLSLYGKSFAARSVLTFAAVYVILCVGGELSWAVLLATAMRCVVIFFYDFTHVARLLHLAEEQIVIQFHLKNAIALTLKTIPVAAFMFLLALQSSVLRVVLERVHGETILGYFAALLYPMMLAGQVVSALGQAATPRFARYARSDTRAFWRLFGKTMLLVGGLALFGVLCVCLFGKWGLTLLYDQSYAIYYTDFILIAIGSLFLMLASHTSFVLASIRLFREQLYGAIVAMGISVAGVFYFVLPLGLRGAVYTYGVTSFALCCSNLFFLIIKTRSRNDIQPVSQYPLTNI